MWFVVHVKYVSIWHAIAMSHVYQSINSSGKKNGTLLLIIISHVIKPERSYVYKTTIFKLEIDVVCALYQNTISGMSIILLVLLVHVMTFKTCVDGNPCLMK